MAIIRPFAAGDVEDLYAIALATGRDGADAFALYQDKRLIGAIYAAPYGALEPEGVVVAEDEVGVGGYVVGVRDTRAFEARLEADWWPALRKLHPDPTGSPPELWTPDQLRAFMIHHPRPVPDSVALPFPAHLHLNLLPRLQGRGIAGALLGRWFEGPGAGGVAAHVGVSRANARGEAFWRRRGFSPLPLASRRTTWLGRPA